MQIMLSKCNPPACWHWLHSIPGMGELGVAKTCSTFHPNLAEESSQITSLLVSYNEKLVSPRCYYKINIYSYFFKFNTHLFIKIKIFWKLSSFPFNGFSFHTLVPHLKNNHSFHLHLWLAILSLIFEICGLNWKFIYFFFKKMKTGYIL